MPLLLITASAVVILDQISKSYIRHLLMPGASIPLIKGLIYITHVENKGAAFGLLAGRQGIFVFITIISIVLIMFYYFRAHEPYKIFNIALGLELGGAIGNLVDRLAFGKVTDFINFRIWPVFNVADTAIVVGVGVLILASVVSLVSGAGTAKA